MNNETLVAFGNRVRKLRKAKHISQERLAELSGIDRSYMGEIERGEKNIGLLKITQVAAALDVTISELFNY